MLAKIVAEGSQSATDFLLNDITIFEQGTLNAATSASSGTYATLSSFYNYKCGSTDPNTITEFNYLES